MSSATKAATGVIPVVVYASKSSPDEKQSVAEQLEAIQRHLDLLNQVDDTKRVLYADPFHEEKQSGWSKDRGPELEAALRAAEDAAEAGEAELWVWKSERLARGSGKKDEARSVLEVFVAMKRAGVRLRSVADDEFIQNEATIGMASTMASKYSDDLSANVRRAKAKAREEGKRTGTPTLDGYLKGSPHHDPEREPVMRRLFSLALEKTPVRQIARTLNAEGLTTARGKSWRSNTVADKILNPAYAGGVQFGTKFKREVERVIRWDPADPLDPYITRAQYEDLYEVYAAPKNAYPAKRGRPAENHLLAGLATCGDCGSPMRNRTSSHKRKDGSKAKHYRCGHAQDGTGECTAQGLNAEKIDALVLEHLSSMFVDLDRFLEVVVSSEVGETAALEAERDAAADQVVELQVKQSAIRNRLADKLAEGGDPQTLEGVLGKIDSDVAGAEGRLAELSRRIDEAGHPADAGLDAWSELRNEVRGFLGRGSMKAINEGLQSRFESFVLRGESDGSVTVLPLMRVEAAIDVAKDWLGGGDNNPTAKPLAVPPAGGYPKTESPGAFPTRARPAPSTPTPPACGANSTPITGGTCRTFGGWGTGWSRGEGAAV